MQALTLHLRGGERCIGLADFGMGELVADFAAHAPRVVAEAVLADWLRAD